MNDYSRSTYDGVSDGYATGVDVTSGLLSADELLYILDEIPVELPNDFDPLERCERFCRSSSFAFCFIRSFASRS